MVARGGAELADGPRGESEEHRLAPGGLAAGAFARAAPGEGACFYAGEVGQRRAVEGGEVGLVACGVEGEGFRFPFFPVVFIVVASFSPVAGADEADHTVGPVRVAHEQNSGADPAE